ncbi:SRPBCC family protein [Amycolatopsis rubida]|uniref:Carbon monoxide dehydrogenase subunit G n=1 Tax=Amycolatopsis rubida TaxID=112413 RepID=A0A1I5FXL6_9PSEU|nr:SRPBCC family protein [Amycolatopsis rubida]SFO28520.1 Carbon monoxide dehydrogenase subunit G [Amycolatopsis rubida]
MEFSNDFIVPTDIATAWTVLTDVPRIAPCLPGATVEPADGDSYRGSVSMKVGPIKVSYGGTAAFRELDEPARRMVLDARGKEKTGKGSAAAVVTVTLHEASSDKTRVDVHTDLQITGKLAQFGRSAMADVGARLIGQFATNLEALLAPAPQAASATDREPSRNGRVPATSETPTAARPGSDLNALALVAPLLKRAVPAVGAFTLGVLLTWLVGRRGTARSGERPVALP